DLSSAGHRANDQTSDHPRTLRSRRIPCAGYFFPVGLRRLFGGGALGGSGFICSRMRSASDFGLAGWLAVTVPSITPPSANAGVTLAGGIVFLTTIRSMMPQVLLVMK